MGLVHSFMEGFVVMMTCKTYKNPLGLTFWERKEDMDSFYDSNNNALSEA